MNGLEMLKLRRSVRNFSNRKIDDNIIEEILDCARLAPTARNVQPWIFVMVKDDKLKEQLSQITSPNGSFISRAPICIVVFCKETKYYLEDGCAATMNILLAATYFGLGSCWVAGDKKDYSDKVRELLKIPSEYKLISLIPIGYPDSKNESGINKKKLREIFYINTYENKI